jgi:hypothetical protein
VQFFLLEGFRAAASAYGIYHPDYDAHVYRDIELDGLTAEPLNGGHDEASLPYGRFTFDRLSLLNCRLNREALIQLTAIGPAAGISGHFRDVTIKNSQSSVGGIVDFGGGPRTNKVEPAVEYYFHGNPTPGTVTRVASIHTPAALQEGDFREIADWTGPDARSALVKDVPFPELVVPMDDLPPATLITYIVPAGKRCLVSGVSHDNREVRSVVVNGLTAKITAQHAGVADWTVTLDTPADGRIRAHSTDGAGNIEQLPHKIQVQGAH